MFAAEPKLLEEPKPVKKKRPATAEEVAQMFRLGR